ncbi:hypothetical protein ABZV31_12235 [Streptomyces sp. NPDC005202]|uniref:hypothetical protein n=1 Tax=Streptomyces sp. NPDC005202 TaxID=3157021 RepID=UPI0033A64BB3
MDRCGNLAKIADYRSPQPGRLHEVRVDEDVVAAGERDAVRAVRAVGADEIGKVVSDGGG